MAAKTVDEYIAGTNEATQALLQAARQVILDTALGIEEYMKWGAPAYRMTGGDQLFYLYGGEAHVNLGFLLGAQLDDPDDLLLGEGSKDSRHVLIEDPADADRDAVRSLITQSLAG